MKKYTLAFVIVLAVGISAYAQLIKTSLTLTIRDELGNIAAGTSVKIFETRADYEAEKNAVQEGTTDAKGIVRFKELKAIPYFVLAKKGDKDNAGGGEETGKLEEKKFNKATIVIQ